MLPLTGSSPPTSPETLAEALRAGLAAHGLIAASVSASGEWPQLDALAIDLTGALIDTTPALPHPDAGRTGNFSAKTFTLHAAPALVRGAPLDLEISGLAATFALAPAGAESVALLTGAAEGNVILQIPHGALEQLIHRLASEAAREHGVEIKQTRVTLTSRGPRAVSIVAEVTAKAFIATATVTLSGEAELDDQFVARLSNLRFSGEGMIANLAGSVIRPVLTKLEGRTFPLLDFIGGEFALRDVRLEVGESLRLVAQFGR